jgi:hypothetical protein
VKHIHFLGVFSDQSKAFSETRIWCAENRQHDKLGQSLYSFNFGPHAANESPFDKMSEFSQSRSGDDHQLRLTFVFQCDNNALAGATEDCTRFFP